jgi:16S rRNA (guanine527-N7)-methyltransferase
MSDIARLLSNHQILITPEQAGQFDEYESLLVEWNKKMNLTAISDHDGIVVKHFYDSCTLAFDNRFASVHTLIDVGSGAGFPSLPLKIIRPDLKVTVVDSLDKRLIFLEALVERLGLSEIKLVHARAEDAGHRQDLREQFDLATARAVARLNVLSEYCLPFVKKEGFFAAMKGPEAEEELNESHPAIKQLGGIPEEINCTMLPFDNGKRNIIWIKKTKKTPKSFPRKAGVPARHPL